MLSINVAISGLMVAPCAISMLTVRLPTIGNEFLRQLIYQRQSVLWPMMDALSKDCMMQQYQLLWWG